jgi:hypothetical protein
MKTTWVAIAFAVLAAAGCATAPRDMRAGPPDLAGSWQFEVQTGAAATHGEMRLAADGPGYRGSLTTSAGSQVLPVRSLTLEGSTLRMRVESPQGEVVFDGVLGPNSDSFAGTVTYHTGARFPMSGRRVPAPPSP